MNRRGEGGRNRRRGGSGGAEAGWGGGGAEANSGGGVSPPPDSLGSRGCLRVRIFYPPASKTGHLQVRVSHGEPRFLQVRRRMNVLVLAPGATQGSFKGILIGNRLPWFCESPHGCGLWKAEVHPAVWLSAFAPNFSLGLMWDASNHSFHEVISIHSG